MKIMKNRVIRINLFNLVPLLHQLTLMTCYEVELIKYNPNMYNIYLFYNVKIVIYNGEYKSHCKLSTFCLDVYTHKVDK